MVKHAADQENPLLTAGERVDMALARVTAGRNFTLEQQQWLERIRVHLQENLSIDEDDFETLPVFTRHGGWPKARSVFAGHLPALLEEINAAVAA